MDGNKLMGKASRDKGLRLEREAVHLFQERGHAAERIPLSGSAGGRFSGDVSVPILGVDTRFEVKGRADGFRQLYAWLDGNYGVLVKADRKPFLAVLPLDALVDLIEAAETARAA